MTPLPGVIVTRLFFFALLLLAQIATASTEVHFSPHDGCEDEVVGLISGSKQQIDIAIYSLNNRAIIKAIGAARDRGVKIRMVIDHGQANTNKAATFQLERLKINFRLHSTGKIMHDKLGIFDHRKIITGSFNWTEAAENKNEENCIMIDDKKVVEQYDARFDNHIWPKNTQEKSDRYLIRLNHKLTDLQQAQLKKDQSEL